MIFWLVSFEKFGDLEPRFTSGIGWCSLVRSHGKMEFWDSSLLLYVRDDGLSCHGDP